ncbi:cupin domain-containing protein [Amycolatopsis sp. NPDC051372]|uniref:cupin domain-containing protein n=1 Tax=Amycolatopsis sp. NPDC051372 TaxID=3155669 RepID=UPI00343EACAD
MDSNRQPLREGEKEVVIAGIRRMSPDNPEEVRRFQDDGGQLEMATSTKVRWRATFRPGWQWSNHVKPIAGTESCEVPHRGYVISGRMTVRMNDGEEETFGAGDFMLIPPGHAGWVVGDEPCVVIDLQGMTDCATQKT